MNAATFDSPVPAAPSSPLKPALLALGLLLAWVLLLYWETGWAMVAIWLRSGTYTHDFLVLPIVGWLIWRQRAHLRHVPPVPAAWVLLPVMLLGALWLLGQLVAVNALTQTALMAFLVLAVPALLGLGFARRIIFPLCFVFFAVPVGEFLVNQLMEWTANVTVLAVRLSGIPVYREGMQFVIPSGTWSVVEACSGVRYLIASVTVGTLFAYLSYRSLKRRLLFIAVSVAVPIVANWMRAYMIVMVGHLSSNQLATGVDHLIYGWLFFGVVILLMFLIGSRWSEPEAVLDAPVALAAGAAGGRVPAKLWLVAGGFALIAAVPRLVWYQLEQPVAAASASWDAPAVLAGGWRLADAGVTDFKPSFQNPTAEIHTAYTDGQNAVGLYLGFYNHQNYQRKLISSDNQLVLATENAVWAVVRQGQRPVKLDGELTAVRTAEIRGTSLATASSEQRRLLAWQVYWVNGVLTTSDYLAKAYSALNRLAGRGDDCAVIVVYAQKAQDGGDEAALESFLSRNYAAIHQMLLARRAAR